MIGGVKGVCTERWLDGGGVKDVRCSGGFVGPHRTHQHPRAVCRSVWLGWGAAFRSQWEREGGRENEKLMEAGIVIF